MRPDAVFIQSESAEYFHLGATDPATVARASWENQVRFLSFDFLYAVPPAGDVLLYLLDNGLTREEFNWFMEHGLGDRIVMGNDFYERNEQIVAPGGEIRPAGEVFGWSVITRQYFDRYRRPVMHTETNNIGRSADDSPALAMEAVPQRAQLARARGSGPGLHLVLAHRPGGLG